MSELDKLKERVHSLERFKRDVIIGVIVVGTCSAAFLSYQSYVAIPKAIEDSFKQTALNEAKDEAKQYLAEIEELLTETRKYEKNSKESSLLSYKYATSSEQKLKETKQLYEEARVSEDKFNRTLNETKTEIVKNVTESAAHEIKQFTADARTILNGLTDVEEAAKATKLIVENDCSSAIKFAIWYTAAFGVTRGAKWWELDPNQSSSLIISRIGSVELGSPTIFYYAEATDESKWVWKGDEKIEIEGDILEMKKRKLTKENGTYKLKLTCS